MIRSIPNPPMDRDDVERFFENWKKHLRVDYGTEERHHANERKIRTKEIKKRITTNWDSKNLIIGY